MGKFVILWSLLLPSFIYGEVKSLHEGTIRSVFPARIEVEDTGRVYELQATGSAVRSMFVVKVYNVAHYMVNPPKENSDRIFEDVLGAAGPKQLTMRWMRDIALDKIRDTYYESFDKVLSGDEQYAFSKEIGQFITLYDCDAHSGDEHILRWTKSGNLELLCGGVKKGEVANPEFTKAIWGLWFGPSSVVDRNRLVDLTKGT